MIKVRATEAFERKNKALKEFHRVMKAGEEFEITEERFEFLSGNNPFNIVFVEKVEEPVVEPIIEEVIEEPKVEAPVIEEVTIDELIKDNGPLEVEQVFAPKRKKKNNK